MSSNWAENLVDGHRVLPVLMADLRAARSTIHFSTFLWFNDPIGQAIADELCRKAIQGVRVRVLVNLAKTELGDPFSTGEQEMMERDPDFPDDALDSEALARRMRGCGVELYDSNLDFDCAVNTDDVQLLEQRRLIRDTSRMDAMHVDHRKVIVIDGRVAYLGSANIGAQYLHWHAFDPAIEAKEEARRLHAADRPEAWWKWHDGFVRFEGPVALELDRVFRERWVLDGGSDYGVVETVPGTSAPRGIPIDGIELFKNQPDATPNACRRAFLESIRSARESIFIENPYLYHPDIVGALLDAKGHNASMQITLIVPALQWNDNEYAQDALQHHYASFVRAGIRVFEYQNHFNHLKLAVFDERVSIVGSANLNFRSLENDCDFELIARVHSPAFARSINEQVRDVDLRTAVEMTEDELSFSVRRRDPRTLFLVGRRVL